MHNVTNPCTNLKLRQLDRRVTRHYDRYVSAVGLRNTQYALLSYVMAIGPVRPSDLATQMQMDRSTLTRNLRPLVEQGWLQVGTGADARSRQIDITETGRGKRAEGHEAWKQAQRALAETLGSKRVAALHTIIADCMGCLDEDSGGSDA